MTDDAHQGEPSSEHELPTGDLYDGGDNLLTDIGAERALIGHLLMDSSRMGDVVREVNEGDFTDPMHRNIFASFVRGFEEGWNVDKDTVVEAMGGNPDAVVMHTNGLTVGQYIARLIVDADMTADPGEMAAQIFDASERRARSDASNEQILADNTPFVSRMGLKMWADRNDPQDEYEFIVEDLIPKNEGVVIMGESGTGKSFLTDHLALCGARGVPFFGRRILKPFGTIWFAYEAARGQTARMRAYAHHYGVKQDDLPFAVLTKPIPLWPDPKAFEETAAEIRGIERHCFGGVPVGMCVFDTYNAATPGASEIDSEVVSKIRLGFDFIRREIGCSTVIVGHTNAQGKHRGNEQLTNNIDTVIEVKRKTHIIDRQPWPKKDDDGREIRTMRVRKQREGQDGEENDFVLHVVEDGTFNQYGRPRTSCVVTAPNIADVGNDSEPSRRQEGQFGVHATKAEQLFIQCLLDCLDDFGQDKPPALGLPPSVSRVVEYDHVKRELAKKMLREEDDSEAGRKAHRDRVKKALKRAREQMMHAKVVGCHDPFIWWTGKAVSGVKATQAPSRTLFDAADETPSAGDITDFY
jgi:AAA domain/DnaB-like helicase N terminal domain